MASILQLERKNGFIRPGDQLRLNEQGAELVNKEFERRWLERTGMQPGRFDRVSGDALLLAVEEGHSGKYVGKYYNAPRRAESRHPGWDWMRAPAPEEHIYPRRLLTFYINGSEVNLAFHEGADQFESVQKKG